MYTETHPNNRLSPLETDGQGIPDQLDGSHELYDGSMHMICIALEDDMHADPEDNMHADPEKSVLAKATIKLAHPETYAGVSLWRDIHIPGHGP